MTEAPDFSGVLKKAHVKRIGPEETVVRAVPQGKSIYRCYCCQDTGIVQTWKLEKFTNSFGYNLDPSMSIPVFCRRLLSCGDSTLQVYSGYRSENDEGTRTVSANLFTTPDGSNTTIGRMIAEGSLPYLTGEQSLYIHNKVMELHGLEAKPVSKSEILAAIKSLR